MSEKDELHLQVTKALYDAAGQGDWETAESYLTDDFFVTEAPHHPMAGVYRGKQGLQNLFVRVMAEIDIVGLDIIEITVGGDYAIGIIDMLLAGDPPSRVPLTELFRFRDGKVCEIRPYYFDSAPLAGALKRK